MPSGRNTAIPSGDPKAPSTAVIAAESIGSAANEAATAIAVATTVGHAPRSLSYAGAPAATAAPTES